MFYRAALIAVVAFVVSGCVTAKAAPQCKPGLVLSDWEIKYQIAERKPLNQDQRMMFLRGYNSTPPVSDYNQPDIYLWVVQGRVIALFADGPCITQLDEIPIDTVVGWMTSRPA